MSGKYEVGESEYECLAACYSLLISLRNLSTMEASRFVPPPPQPPPLLTDEQILFLSQQGHLQLQLPPSLLVLYEQLATASTSFFNQPLHVKTQDYPADDLTEKGYTWIEGEKEYITFRYNTRPDSDKLEQLAGQVWQQTSTLLYRILEDLARAMGLTYGLWDSILDGCFSMPLSRAEATPTLLRTFRYLPNSGTAEHHTDLGLLTVCVGLGKGLQVLLRGPDGPDSAKWVDARGPIIFIGQVLRTLSRNRLRAGLHRVVGNPAGRQSIVFALRPSLRHDRTNLAAFGGEGILSMSKLWTEIRGSRFNVNAQKQIRAEQKEQMRTKQGYRLENGGDLAAASTC